MKKIFLVLAAFATMVAVSCVQDEMNPEALVPEEETPGPADPGTPSGEAKVVFNELCGNKVLDGNKYIELYNAGDAEGNLEGWTIRKYVPDAVDVPGKYDICWTAPANTKLAAGKYLVLKADMEDPAEGFNAGLSAKKGVKFELVDASGKVVDKFVRGADVDPFVEVEPLSEHKTESFSRVPDGTGDFVYAEPTPGEANGEKTGEIEEYVPFNPSTPDAPKPEAKVVFNELCGNKVLDGNKFIELYNAGDAEGNLEGWTIRKYVPDAVDVPGKYDICWTAPANTKLAAGKYLVLKADMEDPAEGFNAGLSAKKGVKFELVDASGKVVDKFVRGADVDPFVEIEPLSEHKTESFSRVPDGTGEWVYAEPTPSEKNGEKTGEIEHE